MCSHHAPPITPPLPSLSLAPRRSRTPRSFLSCTVFVGTRSSSPPYTFASSSSSAFPPTTLFFLHVPSFAAFLFQFVLCLPFFRFSSPSTLTLRPLPLPRFFLCCSVRAPLSSPYPSGRSSARFHLCGVCRVQRGWSVVGQGRWELWRTLRRGAAAAGQVGGRGRGLTPHLLTLTLSVVFILTTSPTATPFFSPPLFFCCFRPRRKQCDTGDCRPMPSDTIAPFK